MDERGQGRQSMEGRLVAKIERKREDISIINRAIEEIKTSAGWMIGENGAFAIYSKLKITTDTPTQNLLRSRFAALLPKKFAAQAIKLEKLLGKKLAAQFEEFCSNDKPNFDIYSYQYLAANVKQDQKKFFRLFETMGTLLTEMEKFKKTLTGQNE